MKLKQICLGIIFCLMCLMVLAGCQMETPAPTVTAEPELIASGSWSASPEPQGQNVSGESIFQVSTVDEFLAAIGNKRVIALDKGVYDLSLAEGYGTASGENWYWQESYDGYELVISGVSGLRICGNVEKTEILIQPRYADVITFEDCSGITIQTLTLGHSPEPGLCAGGVVYLDGCEDVKIEDSYLFGCGIIGLQAYNSKSITLSNSHIYDCSQKAVQLNSCNDVRLEDCKIHNNGSDFYGGLFQVETSKGFAIVNCDIYENEATCLISSSYSQQVNLLGCEVRDNVFTQCLFDAVGYSPIVDKCSFDSNADPIPFGQLPALNNEGKPLTRDDIESMQREKAKYEGPVEAAPVELDETVNEEGLREVTVSTVDEFLAAIGSDTVIKLKAATYDLSTATDYGAYGTDYYYWNDAFDGPSLIVSGVSNLSIMAEEGTVIAAIPRYADVLRFVNCDNLLLSGFTAGHTEEPGSCTGGVLSFENCWGIDIENCHLYGCGILGIQAWCCSELYMRDTEIYDCSAGAIALYTVMDAKFENMNIHDCAQPELSTTDCMDIYFEGEKLQPGVSSIVDGKAIALVYR